MITSVTPYFEDEKQLKRFLSSPWLDCIDEVIIVDDGSTDRTPDIAQKFCLNPKTRYVRQENAGHAAALNTGLSLVQGDLVAFIDHDDLWMPQKLALQTELLQNNPSVDLAFTEMQNFADGEGAAGLKFSTAQMVGYMPGTMMVRKHVLHLLGGFDQGLDRGIGAEVFVGEKQLDVGEVSRHGAVRGAPAAAHKEAFPQLYVELLEQSRQYFRFLIWNKNGKGQGGIGEVGPLADQGAIPRCGDLASVMLGQMQQDRAGFADGHRLSTGIQHAVIPHGGEFSEGVDRQKLRLQVLAASDRYVHKLIGNPLLFHVPTRHGSTRSLTAIKLDAH